MGIQTKLGRTYKLILVALCDIWQTLVGEYMLQAKHRLRFALDSTTKGKHGMAPQPHQCYLQTLMLQQLQVQQINYIIAYIEPLGVR